MMQPAFAAGGLADAERGVHHHHHDDAEALGVIDPVDALAGRVARRSSAVPNRFPFVSYTDKGVSFAFTDTRTVPGSMIRSRINANGAAAHRRRAASADGGAARAIRGRAGGAAGRRQDHAGAAGARWRAVGAGKEDHRAGTAAARGARGRGADGGDARARTVGETVGYRVRFGSKVSRRTRIEVVTEGVFTRMVLDDPSLDGVAALLFDEFHERSLDADLGLALARDVQQGLREDLKLLVMSATIDGAQVAKLLGDAPVVESEGRAFPVETRYLGRDPAAPIERQVADAVVRARCARRRVGAGLPARRRQKSAAPKRCCASASSDPAIDIVPLFGALEADVQDRAIAPAPPGRRKVVLATSIAETSLTIEGVRIVVDFGLSRVPRYEPDVGLTRLETVRVSRASADQRRGRAGRTEPGRLLSPVGRAADRLARGLEHPGNPRRRSVRSGARSRALGRGRSAKARLPRSAAARGLDRGEGASARAWRDRRRRPHHRARPAAAAAAAAAAHRAHGGRCGGGGRARARQPTSRRC